MRIKDRVYGEIIIEPGVIADLIESKPLQRLKGISQDGATHFIQPVRDVTRYEHSIGVWYLAHKYNRPIEEQIAALLHDLPHTAFSHVIDFVVQDEHHEFHDRFTKEIILNSEIPDILKKNGVGTNKVLETESFVLLENSLPDLSFDRLDYFFRDGYAVGFLSKDLINTFLNEMEIYDEKFVFTNYRTAASYATLFVSFSRLIWLDPTSHGAFFLVSEAIKRALELGVITQKDFFTDDNTLYKKLEEAGDPKINSFLNRLKPGNEFVYTPKELAEFYGANKPRFVNPLVKTDTGLKRVTELVPSLEYYFKEFSEKYKFLGVNQVNF